MYTTLTFPRSNTELLPAYSISLHSRLCFTSSTCGSQLRSCARLFKSTGLSPLSHAWPYIYKSRAEYPWAGGDSGHIVELLCSHYPIIDGKPRPSLSAGTNDHATSWGGGEWLKHRPVITKHQTHHGTNSSLRPTYLIHERGENLEDVR